MTSDETNTDDGSMNPDWDTYTPPEQEHARVGHALRKINEIAGVSTGLEVSVERTSGSHTTAELEIIVTDAVVDDE